MYKSFFKKPPSHCCVGMINEIKKTVKKDKVICALSGGVDSSVVALLINKAIDNQDKNKVEFNIASKDSISSLKELNTDSSWYKLKYSYWNK